MAAPPAAPPQIVIATPCFGGQVSSLFATSLLKLQHTLIQRGTAGLEVLMMGGDALITRARANLVALFLDKPINTHLLFVDADIAFEPEQVLRLLEFDTDVCAAVYPVKKIDWDKTRRILQSNAANPSAASLSYVLEFDDPRRIEARNGFAKARYAGTGFLMIKRAALLAMCRQYPELQFRTQHAQPDPLAGSPHRFALFDCLIDAKTGHYLSEDYSFCKRWTDMGGEIWADLGSRLAHTGPMTFTGDLATQFAPAPSQEPPAA